MLSLLVSPLCCLNAENSVVVDIVDKDSCWIVVDAKKFVYADVILVVISLVVNAANSVSRETNLDVLCVCVKEEDVNLTLLWVIKL